MMAYLVFEDNCRNEKKMSELLRFQILHEEMDYV